VVWLLAASIPPQGAIRFSTLEAICAALDCQPGDIPEYDPGKNIFRTPPCFDKNARHIYFYRRFLYFFL